MAESKAMLGKAKPKAKGMSRASKPRKSATRSKSPPKAGTKAKPGASQAKPTEPIEGAVLAGMRSLERATGKPSSRLIDQRIRDLGEWRGETLAEVRRLIHQADPDITEDCKWIKPTNPLGVPVWSHAGIVCTGEAYKQVVKLTFARGASLKDPRGLFTSSLEGNTRRAIDIREGEVLDAEAFTALIQAAVAENLRASSPKSKSPPKAGVKAKPGASQAKPIKVQKGEKVAVVLSGSKDTARWSRFAGVAEGHNDKIRNMPRSDRRPE